MALSLDSPAHAPESLACFERGKGCERTAMPARRGTGNTPQHGGRRCCPGTVTRWDGEAKGRWAVRAGVPRLRQRTENQFFTFPCLVLSSRLSARQAGRLLMSEYCIYIHGYTHMYSVTDGSGLCASYFLSSLLCTVCGHT